MRARNIKPGFFANEELAECSPEARLLFIGLWCMADREGRLEDRPKRISKELFGYELIDVVPLLNELESKQFIVRYCGQSTSDQGQKPVNCIYINNFGKHQSPHRNEAESVLPSVDESTSVLGQKPLCPWPVPLALNEDCLIADCLNEERGLSDCGIRKEEGSAIASTETKPPPPPKPAPPPEPRLPASIDTPEMQVAWSEWLQHRKEIKKPLTATQKEKQLKKFARKGVVWSLAAIENTIEHGWIGLLHPSEQGGGNRGHPVGDARGNLALRDELLAAARAKPQEAPNDPT